METRTYLLTTEERTEIKNSLLEYVRRVTKGGFELHSEEFTALPEIVNILLYMETETAQ